MLVKRPRIGRTPGNCPPEGFTSVELLFVLAVVAILVTLAAPGLRDMLRKQRLTSSVNDLFVSVNLTRAEALARGRRVDLAPTDGRDWVKGWTVFVDMNGDQIPNAGDQIIYVHGSLPSDITIDSTFPAALPPYVAFNGTGRTRSNAGPQSPRFGSWILTLAGQRRKIVLNFLGRARVCDPAIEAGC